MAAEITKFVLASLVRRLDTETAHRLVSRFNDELKADLMEAAPGSDPTISISSILDGLIWRFGLSEQAAQSALVHVGIELAHVLEPHDLADLEGHLPDDLQILFPHPARTAA